MNETIIRLTFDYKITESTVAFNGKTYSKSDFLLLNKEIDLLSRSDSTTITCDKKYGADFVLVLKDGQILIPAEIWCVEDFIKMDIIDKSEYTLTNFNKYFGYIIASGYVIMIDDEKTRHGIWLIKDIVKNGVPTDENEIDIIPNGKLSLSENKYPFLTGSHVIMGFTKSQYKKFIEVLKGEL